MSATQTVSELFARLGSRVKEATDAHLKDEIKTGFVELPSFPSGVAKLSRVEFYADGGVLKFRAVGTMDAPMYADGGVPLKGLETAQFATVSETDTDGGISQVLDVLRKLVGQDTLDVLVRSYTHPVTGVDYEKVVAAVSGANAKRPIYFRCSNKFEENRSGRIDSKTGKPYPGRVWQRWGVAVPDYTPVGAPPVAVKPSVNGVNGVHLPAPTIPSSASPAKPDPAPWESRAKPAVPQPTVHIPETFPLTGADEPDWDQLAVLAESDAESCKTLYDAANALGYTEDDCGDATSMAIIAGWVKSGVKKGGGDVVDTVTGKPAPKQGNTVKFYPMDSTNTRRLKRGVMCEITGISADIRTMSLKCLTDSRTWDAVAWDDPSVEYAKK